MYSVHSRSNQGDLCILFEAPDCPCAMAWLVHHFRLDAMSSSSPLRTWGCVTCILPAGPEQAYFLVLVATVQALTQKRPSAGHLSGNNLPFSHLAEGFTAGSPKAMFTFHLPRMQN